MNIKRSNTFKYLASLIIGIMVLFWIIASIIGMIQGVPREVNNLVVMLVIAALTFLAWKRPLLGGILLSAFGIVLAIYFFMALPDIQTAVSPLLLMCTPTTIAGLIFIEAEWALKKKE
jgi:hypothetical protein